MEDFVTGAPSGLQDILPLSPLQHGLYFLSSYDDTAPDLYNVQLAFDLEGPLDRARIRRAGEALLRRHPNLMAAFRQRKNGEPVTLIPHGVELPWSDVDLTELPPESRERRLAQLTAADRRTRFDLATPPLTRFTAIRLGEERHRLLLTHHHLLLDGWSTARVVQELFTLYESDGDPSGLPAVRPYRDYLAWAAARDASADDRAWAKALAGLDGPTIVAPSPAGPPSGEPVSLDVGLPPALGAEFAAAVRALDVTLPVAVQTLWSIALGELTGRRDIVSGTTVSGRPAELDGVETMVGLFINTLPVRVSLRPAESPAGLLRRIAAEQAALLPHHHTGLAGIQRTAGFGGPLFDTLCVFENYLAGEGDQARQDTEFAGLRVTAVSGRDATHYPLTLVAAPTPDGGPALSLSHHPDAVAEPDARRLADRLRRLVEEFTADPHRPLARLDPLTAAERERVLHTFNAHTADIPPATLPELFERIAAEHPDAPALVDGPLELTYRQLNERANLLAHQLIAHGVGPENIVAAPLERGVTMLTAQLAIAKAGGVFAPLDPNHPSERLSTLITASGATHLLLDSTTPFTTRSHPQQLHTPPERIQAPPAIEARGPGQRPASDPHPTHPAPPTPTPIHLNALPLTGPTHNPTTLDHPTPLHLDHPAYLIHTSGSTGTPKGVVVAHRPLADLTAWARESFGTGPGDRVTQFASPAFDVTLAELAASLLSGATLVVVPEERRAGAPLASFLAEADITLAVVPPTVLASLPLDAVLPAGMTMAVGTEALPPEVLRVRAARHRIVNAYGPTEAVVNSATWRVPADWSGGPVPIGPPDVNKRALVLDDMLRPVPPGVLGELYLAGAGLARGYLGRPGVTADRFVAAPTGLGAPPGARMYRTGDLARWNAAGELEYAGRADHQLKVRGFRVEPGEVEARLTAHPGVARAVVTAPADARGIRRLVAHAVPAPGEAPDPAELIAWVGRTLPDHLTPSAVVLLDALPLTPANKIDRAALPAPDFSGAAEGTAPRTGTESRLAELFAEVLAVPAVGVHDSFFALGGDSISAIQLVGAARRHGLVLRPRDVFDHRTVEALAAAARTAAPARPAARRSSGGSAPLTPVLRSLVERGGPLTGYHQSMVLHTPAGARLDALTAGLAQVVGHHEALRARLTPTALEIPPEASVNAAGLITRVDAEGAPAEGLTDVLRPHARRAAAELDPYRGDMVRAVWLDAGAERGGLLALLIHHAVVDGVSWRVLTEDLAAACEAARTGATAELAPVGTSFTEWATGLREAAAAPGRTDAADDWAALLDGDHARIAEPLDPAADTLGALRTVSVRLDPATAGPLLTELPARYHTGPDTVLLAALAMALAAWRGHTGPVPVDLEGHGREEESVPGADLSRTVGWFTSVHPALLDLGGLEPGSEAETGAVLKRVKEQLRPPSGDPLGHGLLRHLHPAHRERFAALPRPEIGYNYLGRFGAPGGGGEGAEPKPWSPALTGSFGGGADDALPLAHALQLNVSAVDGPEGPTLHAGFGFSGRLLAEPEVARLAELWLAALRTLRRHLGDPGAGGHTPSDFPLVTVAQPEIDALEDRRPLADLLPLSPLQEGLHFLAAFGAEGDGPDVYVTQTTLEFAGELESARMREAGRLLLARHPNLRAAFHTRRGADPLQSIAAEAELPWAEYDLGDEPEPPSGADRAGPAAGPSGGAGSEAGDGAGAGDGRRGLRIPERARRILAAERERGFDLSEPPLIRLTLVRLGDGRRLFALTSHHILLDGWSGPVLIQDLLALYRGEPGPAPRPYRDYLLWLAGRDRAETRELWRETLAGIEGPTLLVPHAAGAPAGVPERMALELPDALVAKVFALARAEQVTVNAVLQTAWALVLGRLTGRTDVAFGVTVSGRPADLDGAQQMVGLFINTVPARVETRPDQPVAELIRRVADQQTRLMDHQYEPLAELQRLAGHRELFDTLILFENFPVDAAELRRAEERAGLRVTAAQGHDATHYPLVLVALPGRERLALALDHRPDILSAERARAVGALLTGTLELLADRPRDPARAVVPGGAAPARLDGPAGPVTPLGLAGRFLRQAAATPEGLALIAGDEEWSYARLAARAGVLAARLTALGAGPETLIAVALPRSADLVAALLAVAAAGAAYVPVDPDFPAERVAHLLADSRPLLTVDADSPVVTGAGLPEDAAVSGPLPGERPHPDGVAYVIHTSGSTGAPKGVVVTHEGLANLLDAMAETLSAGPGQRLLAVTTVSFDIAALELFVPLVTGAAVILADRDQSRDPMLLAALAERAGATHLQATPSLWRGLTEAAPRLVRGLTVLSGGEPLPADLAGELADGGDRLLNLYGPTETTVWSTAADLGDGGGDPHIGTALRNTTLRLLDSWLRPVPDGTPGELYIGGSGVARGYLGRAALTSGRFVADPYGVPGARIYRTGDLAARLPDGTLRVLGRADHQLKVRGHRVEPGEIEAVLRSHPAVGDAVVVGSPDASGAVRLIGYLTGDAAGVREFLGERLPEYLVPSLLIELDEMPLTPNGKTDRAALPAPESAAASGGRVRAPRDPREAVLAELFADVLSLPRVGPDDDFFRLGGHSLLAMRLANRLRSALGADVALRDVFDHPTPAALAETVLPRGSGRAALAPRTPVAGERLPLSFAQSRLWFLHRLDGPSATYNLFFALRLGGELDTEAMRLAVGDVVTRHESLRTVYPDVDGLPHQHILDEETARAAADPVVLRVAEADLERAVHTQVTHPVDIVTEIPLRVRLLRTETDHVLCVMLHHIAGDEWSMRPLTEDLRTAYTARAAGNGPDWRPLPVGYADYAVWQRDLLGSEDDPESLVARQAAHWRRELAGAPEELALPYDRPRPAEEHHDGRTVTFEIDARTHRTLRALSAENGTSVFMAAQAGLAVLLAAHGAGTDLPIGTPVAGRTDAALDDLVGFFVNTLVLRTDLSGRPTFREILGRVRDTDLAAFDNADLPFEQLVEMVAPERTLARNPLFQVMLVFQNVSDDELTLPGLTVTPLGADPGTAKLDLMFTLAERPGGAGVNGMLTFQTSLFDESTARALADRYTALLSALAERPDLPFHRAGVLTPAERARILAAGAGEERPLPAATLPALLSARYAATPAGEIALVADGLTLSTAEFDARVGRLAALLRDLGVRPETRVAVALPRSADLVVALHAVHRAGGAYVPLDTGHPPERLAHVLTDSAPAVVLTRSEHAAALPLPDGAEPVLLDDPATEAALAAAGPVPVLPEPLGDHAAYVLYTSGSTGRPKGVTVSHAALVNRLRWMAEEYGIGPGDRVLQKTPAGFDVSVWEFFLPMLTGAVLAVLPDGQHTDPVKVAAAIRRHEVTTVHFVPSMLAAFAAEPSAAGCASLRLVVASGEALPRAVADALREALPGAALHNLYGPTEATVDVTAHPAGAPDPGGAWGGVPIGRPVWNTGAHVLDAWLRPAPDGVTGELYLSGRQLARGYHGRPALTCERFVAHPFGAPGERLYRTGDLVRRRPDGALVFAGRADGQVKLRGLRVELGEIEAVLGEDPEIAAAAVLLREDQPGRPLLAGYLVPRGDSAPDPAELTARLSRRLPDHMVPTALIALERLPLTPSGKLDRAALPAPDLAAGAGGAAPRGIREALLTELFAELLDAPLAGAEDSFFALGGDSILSIQLVARARRAGLVLTPREVFEHKTPAALARVAVPVDAPGARTLPPAGRLPLTPVMSWARERGVLEGLHQWRVLVTPPDATPATLADALRRLADRHPVLRASLVAEGALEIPGAPAEDGGPLPAADLGGVPAPLLARRLAGHTAEAIARLDPAGGRLFSAVYADLGPGRGGRLLLAVHQLAVDEESWPVLLADLALAHEAAVSGAEPGFPAGTTSFRQWALGLADAAGEAARRAEAGIWRARDTAPAPALGDRPLDAAAGPRARLERSLTGATARALLTEVPASVHGTVQDVVLAAAAIAFAQWRRERGESDAGPDVVAVRRHGRAEGVVPGSDLSRTVGWFTTRHPLLLDTAGVDPAEAAHDGAAAQRVLTAVKEQLRVTPDQGIGHGLLHRFGDRAAEPPRTPEISFAHHDGRPAAGAAGVSPRGWPEAPEDLPWPESESESGLSVPALFPLEITTVAEDGPDGPVLAARWVHTPSVLPAADAERLADLWCAALRTLAERPAPATRTPSDFPLVALGQDEVDALQRRFPSLTDVWPLAPLQEGFRFLTELAGDGLDVYTMQLSLRLAGEIDPAALHAACRDLLDRNENLRTALVGTGGGAVQVVLAEVEPEFAVTDLSAHGAPADSPERRAAPARLAEEDRLRPFDLAAPPLLRLRLVRLAGDGGWALIVTNHHAVLDGWSVPLLLEELFQLYAARTGAAPAPGVRRSFRDYLRWLTRQDPDAARDAWRAALAGVGEPTLIAPADPSRQPVPSRHIAHTLDAGLGERLAELARAADVTPNTVMQFAWGLLLARQTGRDDVVFGATVSGRPPEIDGVEDMTGLFINTVPVRVDLRPAAGANADTVRRSLARLQDARSRLGAYEHLGLSAIQRLAGRDGGAGELFDTLLVFQNYPVDAESLRAAEESGALRVTDGSSTGDTHYPLTLVVAPAAGKLLLEYRPDLFTEAEAKALTGRLVQLLRELGDRPDSPVHRLECLDPAERGRILSEWNATGRPHPAQTLPELLAERIAADPDAPAVVSGDAVLTFGELDARSARLARLLTARGAGPEDVVALMLPRTEEMLVAIVAVHRAGAAYLPLDPGYPAERIAFMARDAAPRLLVTTGGLADAAAALDGLVPEVVVLDGPETVAALAALPGDAPVSPARPGHPAYVIYTSGSTGTPKGVVVTQGNAVNLFHSHRRNLYEPTVERTGRRRLNVGHAWSFSFDASWQPQLWLFHGHCVHVLSEEIQRDPDALHAYLRAHAVDFVEVAPSVLAELERAGLTEGGRCPLPLLGVGGEAVPQEQWDRLRELPGTETVNLYGPTEATVDSLFARVREHERPVIGRPVDNARVRLLDAWLRPVPPGVAGEMYLAGAGLARGYLGRPALTAERFVADPFADDGGRLYRTGDLARWTDDGAVEFLGRVDDQVKIRGFRVELGEIATALGALPGVDRAVVVARTDDGVRRLVGYAVPDPGAAPDPAALRAGLAGRLPDHLVPAAVVLVGELPMTVNGKLDKDRLPAPDFGAAALGRDPSGPAETLLCAVMARVLGLERIGADDDFFALGGDSIVSLRLVAALRAEGYGLSPREVFRLRTPAALAPVLGAGGPARSEDPSAAVGGAPLVPGLDRLRELGGPIDRHSQSTVLRTPAGMRRADLVTAVGALLERHPVLRARLDRGTGESWRLEIPGPAAPGAAEAAGAVERVEAAEVPDGPELAHVMGEKLLEAVAALDPDRGRMVRVVWFDAGPRRSGRLLILLHQFVVDAATWRIVHADLRAAWEAARDGRDPALAPAPTSYRTWARHLDTLGARRSAEAPYWREVLADSSVPLAGRRLDPAADTVRTLRRLTVELGPEDTAPLLGSPAATGGGGSVRAVLLGALSQAFAEWRRGRGETGGDRVVVALESHGREQELLPGADLSRTAGRFTSVHPVALDARGVALDSAHSPVELVRRAAAALASAPDSGIGYGPLRRLHPGLGDEPEVQFDYLGRFAGGGSGGGDWTAAPEAGVLGSGRDLDAPVAHLLDIAVSVTDGPGGPRLDASWVWPGGPLTEAEVRSLADAWTDALRALAKAYGA
ncbi:amino acid adenylation domain-containing protein [Streptomyces sp. NPDC014894]|uniref:amino acid adenylation domain-containing protein n=1 Tax=Streptomyces sp. NPDC014894 TaxID=3364931 RepID=UPI0036F9AF9D